MSRSRNARPLVSQLFLGSCAVLLNVGCSDTTGATRTGGGSGGAVHSDTGGTGSAVNPPTATGGSGGRGSGTGGLSGLGEAVSGASGGTGTANLGGASTGGQPAATAAGGRIASGGATAVGGASNGGASTAPCPQGVGKALKFTGLDEDFVTADLGADLPIGRASRTIELWAKFTSAQSWDGEHSLIEYGAGMDCHVFGIDSNGVGQLDPYGNGCGSDNTVTLVPAVPMVGWLHLAYAYDGPNNKFQFTVNGIEQPIPSPTAEPAWSTTNSPITVGASTQFGVEGFDGVIDEIRVWNISRAPADITRDMRVFLKGNEPGLVAYYHFDEGQGTAMQDATPKAHVANMISDLKPVWVDSDIPGTFSCAP